MSYEDLTPGETQIILAYFKGYGDDREHWTPDKHINGLKAVFRAGADAGRRQAQVANHVE